jgi:hypothetical protein
MTTTDKIRCSKILKCFLKICNTDMTKTDKIRCFDILIFLKKKNSVAFRQITRISETRS